MMTDAVIPRGLRGRTLARLDDAIASVRAYAEVAPPKLAIEMLKALAELQTQRARFELLTRLSK